MERSRMWRVDEDYYSSQIREMLRKEGDCTWQSLLEH